VAEVGVMERSARTSVRPSAPSMSTDRPRDRRRVLRLSDATSAVLAATALGAALIGAVAARAIADDYSIVGELSRSGDAPSAFSWWMSDWTPYYSTYGGLTVVASAGRVIGDGRYTFALVAVAVVLLLYAAMFVMWKRWAGARVTGWPAAAGAAVLGAGLLGSFASFRDPQMPYLFGTLYWATMTVSHTVPLLLAPFALLWVTSTRRPTSVVAVVSVGLGLAVAGFGLPEALVVLAATALTAWGLHRVGGRDLLRPRIPGLASLAIGLVVGLATVALLPGTRARNAEQEAYDGGIRLDLGVADVVRRVLSFGRGAMADVLVSPVVPVAIVVGAALFFAVRSTPERRGDDGVDRVRIERTVLVAMGVLVAVAWAAVTLGDLLSYRAWWHRAPLTVTTYLFGATAGWCLARRWSSRTLEVSASILLVSVMLWSVLLAGSAARGVWDRRATFDESFDRAITHEDQDRSGPINWSSVSVREIHDAEEGGWIADRITDWFGLPRGQITVTVDPEPPATPFDP
jgi:hypothetical protein